MTSKASGSQKITISLPRELVVYADAKARDARTSRSKIIGQALEMKKALEEEQLAAEGYQFYSEESRVFAASSARAAAEAWASAEEENSDDSEAW